MICRKPVQQYLTRKICSLLEMLWRVCADGVNMGLKYQIFSGIFFIFVS